MKFSEDVEQILREHERCEFWPSGNIEPDLCARCGKHLNEHYSRVGRQQIIEEAVREWARRKRLGLNDAKPEEYREGDLEKFFGCCPEMQREDEAALLRGDG